MKRIRYEVLPDVDGSWSVTRDRVVTGGFEDKDRAVDYAVDCCNKSWKAGMPAQLLIKGRDGRIQDERTYGLDPSPHSRLKDRATDAELQLDDGRQFHVSHHVSPAQRPCHLRGRQA